MKEWNYNIHPDDYHRIVYPEICDGNAVAQPDFEGNLFIYASPERYGYIDHVEDNPKPERHPLQGEFILNKKWNNQIFLKY